MDQTKDTKELAMNTKNTWLKASSRTVRQEHELDPLKVNPSFILPNLSNQPRQSYQILGEGEVPLVDVIPTNLEPQFH
jgi:hypothetical protein